jgi:hypothetical protein
VEKLYFEVVILIFYSTQNLQTIFLYAQQSTADRCGHIPEKQGGLSQRPYEKLGAKETAASVSICQSQR